MILTVWAPRHLMSELRLKIVICRLRSEIRLWPRLLLTVTSCTTLWYCHHLHPEVTITSVQSSRHRHRVGCGSGTLHSPFKQNLVPTSYKRNICFTVDVNFIQFSVNSTLYNTCSDSGYGLVCMLQQSNSQSWPNLVILVILSLPGVGREGGRREGTMQCAMVFWLLLCASARFTWPPDTASAASTGLSLSLPQPLLTAVANINLLLDAGLLIFNRPLE